ncbi:MAG: hypothetical protein GX562_04195 [Coriobacteriaceae bacterium]|nr:hypothetical protein [Coriobacteriaceae bacterium]
MVDEYIVSAVPVGSNTLVERYALGYSSATVRNELMGLEEAGYALSPHTSAGRIPTDAGYRIVVNSLLLNPTSLRSTPDFGTPGYRQWSLFSSEQYMETRHWGMLLSLSSFTGCLALLWAPTMSKTIFHRGIPALLEQPEFKDARLVLPLLQLLENHTDVLSLLATVMRRPGVVIRIGGENKDSQLSAFSLIASSYGKDRTDGVVAVVGPTRLDYRRAILAVSTASKILETN